MIIAGDWHMNLEWGKKVVNFTHKNDSDNKILQLGDFGIWPGKDGVHYLEQLSHHLVKKKVKLYFLPGNHEWWTKLNHYMVTIEPNEDGHREIWPNIFYTGKVNSWVWNGKKLATVGGAVSIDKRYRLPDISWWPDEELSEKEYWQATEIGKVDYLFTHDCSDENPFRKMKLMEHRESLLSRIKFGQLSKNYLKPELWFHGHYHVFDHYELTDVEGNIIKAWSLDADDWAARMPFLDHNIVGLNISTGTVTTYDEKIRIKY
jgi:hypothetical protein